MECEIKGLSLNFDPPSDELLAWARDNLNEDPDTKCQKISDLRDMIFERNECTPHRTDDAFLLRFLRSRNFVVERAHRLIANYCAFRENNPEIFDHMDTNRLAKIGNTGIISAPPHYDDTGRRMLICRIGEWDPQVFSVYDLFQVVVLILELSILEQPSQILGGICILDFENLSMQHAKQFTPSVAKKIVQILVTCFPMRIHAVHIVNQSYAFDIAFNMFKPFLSSIMLKHIHFHGIKWDSLHKHISAEFLPKRYQGIHDDFSCIHWINYLRSNRQIREEMESSGYRDCADSEEADQPLGLQHP